MIYQVANGRSKGAERLDSSICAEKDGKDHLENPGMESGTRKRRGSKAKEEGNGRKER